MSKFHEMYNTFKYGSPGSDNIANKGVQVVDIYHIPTGLSVQFKALLTNFDDAYTSEWNSEAVFGRMDSLQTYKRTSRTISIGFDVVAYSKQEAQDNARRLSSLIQFLYPAYDKNDLMANSPLCKIQFRNWCAEDGTFGSAQDSGLVGAIKGLNFTPDLDMGIFSGVGKASFGDEDIYAKKFNIAFQFDVIHQHKLGWQKSNKKWIARSQMGAYFPYGDDPEEEFEEIERISKKSVAQAKAVPNDAKTEVTADKMLSPTCTDEFKSAKTGKCFSADKIARMKKKTQKNKAARCQQLLDRSHEIGSFSQYSKECK